MSFTFDQFKTRFPTFSGVDEDHYNSVKASAEFCVNATTWGVKTDEGVKLMTAHLLALEGRGGSAGSITSQKVGDLERKFSDPMSNGGDVLMSTSYGAQFLSVEKSLVTSPFIV